MLFILFGVPLIIMYVSIFSFIIYKILSWFNLINGRDAKELSVLISIYPAGYFTIYIFNCLFNYKKTLLKALILGPIIVAIIVGIALHTRSAVSSNDNHIE